MAAYHAEYLCDLAKPSQAIAIPHVFTTGDNESHSFTALVYDSSDPACGLMAGNVSGAVVLPDGSTVPLTNGVKGELRTIRLSDGKTVQATPCTVTTVQACFAYSGRVKLLIRLIDGETATTVLAALAQVQQGLTGTIIDPGDVIEDITTLIAEANEAAEDAESALSQATAVVSYAEQTGKTDAQKAQARTNIGAASDALGGSENVISGFLIAQVTASEITESSNQTKLSLYFPIVEGQRYTLDKTVRTPHTRCGYTSTVPQYGMVPDSFEMLDGGNGCSEVTFTAPQDGYAVIWVLDTAMTTGVTMDYIRANAVVYKGDYRSDYNVGTMKLSDSVVNANHVYFCGAGRELATLKAGIEAATQYMDSVLYVDPGT